MSHSHSVFRSVHVIATKYVNMKRGRDWDVGQKKMLTIFDLIISD